MRSDGEIQTSVTERESECALQRQTFSFTSPEKDFFLYSWCDYFTGKRKTLCTILLRYIRYDSSDLRQFHPHMHTCTFCVCGRVIVCVRAGRRLCVYGKQMHTYSSRVFASVAAGAGSGARLICQTGELPSDAVGANTRTGGRVFAGDAPLAAPLRSRTRPDRGPAGCAACAYVCIQRSHFVFSWCTFNANFT